VFLALCLVAASPAAAQDRPGATFSGDEEMQATLDLPVERGIANPVAPFLFRHARPGVGVVSFGMFSDTDADGSTGLV
jgi:hypothetical protein